LVSKKNKVSFASTIHMQQDTISTHLKLVEQCDAIKANDDKILKSLYQENYFKIEKYVLNNNGSREQAKDIYQEAFIVVWRNIQLDRLSAENETTIAGYLFKVAKNKWIDYLRSIQYKKVTSLNDDTEVLQAEVFGEEENKYLEEVKHNFKLLGENCREVLTRFYYKKEPLKDIAINLNWTEATARNNKYRCIQRLREMIKNK
jgi:RNA polymerase sigma factor (sigma-70 family)